MLHLHQVTQGTFTPKLSDMSDTQAGRWPPPSAAAALTGHGVPLRFATKRSTARCGRAAISNRWFSAGVPTAVDKVEVIEPHGAAFWKVYRARSVLIRSPALIGISDGATTEQACPSPVRNRCRL